jgi:hypothetical protein
VKPARADPVPELIIELAQVNDQATGLLLLDSLAHYGPHLVAVMVPFRSKPRDASEGNAEYCLTTGGEASFDLGL